MVPSSCALLDGFATGARVSLLQHIPPNAKCQRVFVLALCLVMFFGEVPPELTGEMTALFSIHSYSLGGVGWESMKR